jgi:hypothetical protein
VGGAGSARRRRRSLFEHFLIRILSIKIRIGIRIKIYKLDPEPDQDPHQFAYVKPKCMEYEPILALFQRFEPLFGS